MSNYRKVKLSNIKFSQTVPSMCKKVKKELKSFWENAHVNVLTLYMRDKLNCLKHPIYCPCQEMKQLPIWLCFRIRKQGIY